MLAQNSAGFSLVPMILLFVAIFPTPFPVHPLNVCIPSVTIEPGGTGWMFHS